MIYKFLDQKIKYDGTQLKSLFAYMNHEILGDSCVAFIGACDIPFEHMVDGEDVLAKSAIRGGLMLHFIIEKFGTSLETAVGLQRLFAAIVREELEKLCPDKAFIREGDDIYLKDGKSNDAKLSISIATVSPVSALIHFAVNITNDDTPVKTLALSDLGLEAKAFADQVGARFINENETIKQATQKVRWVK